MHFLQTIYDLTRGISIFSGQTQSTAPVETESLNRYNV